MLDERHPDLPTKPNDDNTYILGRIHVHNVVIACLPSGVYGTTSAATIASQIRLTFPSIRIGLMVGIGGGVPGTSEDVRLGDVVVSKPTRDYGGIVQYDYGKSLAGGVFARQGVLNKPPPILLTAISRLQAAHLTRPSQISWLVSQAARSSCFAYPGADRDILFDSEYDHLNPESTCTDCDPNRRMKRSIRASQDPKIYYGLIASANQVMKDGCLRDKLARDLGILCFEMEAAGLMDSFPCLVVRGICDYSDSHKTKEWQGYAAATAAAYTKELLSIIHGKQLEDEPSKLSTDNIGASVIETIRYEPSDCHAPTVFFYCENDHTGTLRASSALCSLIRQLAHLRKEIVTFFGRRKITPDFNDLQNIFIQLFDLVPMATYVLDGLDAMEEEQCKLLLTFIRSLFSGARELKGQRILLFSRDQIPGYVNLATLIPGIGRISTFDNTMSDIRTFIDYSISDKSMYRKLTDDRLLLEETKDVLLNESSGMFLWVHLQLEILWSTCFTDAEVRSALRQLPKDLEETYRYCANRINTHDTRALKVLKWVGFASRPLHLEELREAVAFEREDTAFDSNKLPQRDFIIGSCANLVVLDPIDLCVRFAHSSIKQYLVKNGLAGLQSAFNEHCFDEEQGELDCGEFCIAYLCFSNFSLQLEHKCNVTREAVVPSPVLFAGPALNSSLRYLFRVPDSPRPRRTLQLRTIRTSTIPDRSQYKFLNYAIVNWIGQTRSLARDSAMWEKFEKLATCFNETWNFHPWKPGGRSIRSQLHSLFGWAVRDNHEPLLSIALNWKKEILQISLHVASKLGHHDIARTLIKFCDVNMLDGVGYTPLHHAVARSDTEMASLLLSAKEVNTDPVSVKCGTPLSLAAQLGLYEMAELLIQHGAAVQEPIWSAIVHENEEIIKLLVQHGASVNYKGENGQSVLDYAVRSKHKNMPKFLRGLTEQKVLLLGKCAF
ncbi:hypothetical protein BO99DRAFT_422274 [Aspergillus violaceofuscus CBS 115571]|uniref:Uncharacterized protein n=1 Tax=Aspergillus violaceofuscus (strain CBS 115571) TaxID=1450538 RepID=A0A2V5H5S0_ASPV1|nr:hypothetical protein BO99DRAFT_422274 [Aspergillus violaceofuscus CBS 115571]